MASLVKEKAEASARNDGGTSHNLSGQRLGRKGLATRDRIISAMLHLSSDAEAPALTLTAVAREAGIGLPNLYLYFPGMAELLLAALSRVMENATLEHIEVMRERWPDDELEECCRTFVGAHFNFWKRHARLLHMRNSLGDTDDIRILEYRHNSTKPILDFLRKQMETMDGRRAPLASEMVVVLFTGLERMATINTNRNYTQLSSRQDEQEHETRVQRQLDAEARLLALAIRDGRETAARQ